MRFSLVIGDRLIVAGHEVEVVEVVDGQAVLRIADDGTQVELRLAEEVEDRRAGPEGLEAKQAALDALDEAEVARDLEARLAAELDGPPQVFELALSRVQIEECVAMTLRSVERARARGDQAAVGRLLLRVRDLERRLGQ